MTSPVQFDLHTEGDSLDKAGSAKEWTMSFLYRTPDMGTPGQAEDDVVVTDRPEVTVLSIGVASREYNRE